MGGRGRGGGCEMGWGFKELARWWAFIGGFGEVRFGRGEWHQ